MRPATRGAPDAPPQPTVGLSTKLGLLAAAVGALVAGVSAILHGDHTEGTITGAAVAALSIYAVIRSRGEQAAALAMPAPVTTVVNTHPENTIGQDLDVTRKAVAGLKVDGDGDGFAVDDDERDEPAEFLGVGAGYDDGDEAPEFTPEALAGAEREDVVEHVAGEPAAYKEHGQPTPEQVQENNLA